MRFRHGATLIGADAVTLPNQWRLLDELYETKGTAIGTAGVCCTAAGVAIGGSLVSPWLWLWSAICLIVLLGRLLLSASYRTRNSNDSISRWRNIFVVAQSTTAIAWGLGGIFQAFRAEPQIVIVIQMLECCLLSGIIIRCVAVPKVVVSAIICMSSMRFIACVMTDQLTFIVYISIFIFFQLYFSRTIMEIKLRAILSDQQRDSLLESQERANKALADAYRRLEVVSTLDGLTGLQNRREFDRRLTEIWNEATLRRTAVSMIFVDVDHFKQLNDQAGHQAGDDCLFHVASALKAALPAPDDIAARYGGDEFVMVLNGSAPDLALGVARQVSHSIGRSDSFRQSAASKPVTVSIGVATLNPSPGRDPADLIRRADLALYRAKESGRACIRTADDAGVDSPSPSIAPWLRTA